MNSDWELSLRVYYTPGKVKKKNRHRKCKLPIRIRGRSYLKNSSNSLCISSIYDCKDYFDYDNFEIIVKKNSNKEKKSKNKKVSSLIKNIKIFIF